MTGRRQHREKELNKKPAECGTPSLHATAQQTCSHGSKPKKNQERLSGRAGDLLASLHEPQGTCLCWSQPGRGAEASQACQGRQSPETHDGRTAACTQRSTGCGEWSALYKYISRVNAREEKSYFS